MRIIAKKTLREFWEIQSDSEQPLKSWFREMELGNWATFNELKIDFPSASILKENRVVFNIKGNHYRLIVKFNLEYQTGWIRFIGTHAEYDKVNANSI
ncbi:type II toxin-antitoxin system HigB family toxin [Algoriphagus taiwanensis]|uniref:Type II toxin-antitoxin system HigB family toxin n=1 Tax=Algoriphagus taiwanensis TaxID=1445656 RepID=A0ABQ6Q568_9BACT|nr:type II toxin-antitoxin system HigB family toxin [Algoriphagus taiwanensis]